MKNDFSTTSGNIFKFYINTDKSTNSGQSKYLIKELKDTHYKLGYDNDIGLTTQKSDYVPYGLYDNKKNQINKNNNFDLGDKYNNKFEGETIYQTDYVETK